MYEESNGQHLSALCLESAETEFMSTRFEISPCLVAFHQLPYIIRRGFFFLVQMHINLVRTDANIQRNVKKLSKERVMAS